MNLVLHSMKPDHKTVVATRGLVMSKQAARISLYKQRSCGLRVLTKLREFGCFRVHFRPLRICFIFYFWTLPLLFSLCCPVLVVFFFDAPVTS